MKINELTWQDIRRIVRSAGEELRCLTQEQLFRLGEQGYYERVKERIKLYLIVE